MFASTLRHFCQNSVVHIFGRSATLFTILTSPALQFLRFYTVGMVVPAVAFFTRFFLENNTLHFLFTIKFHFYVGDNADIIVVGIDGFSRMFRKQLPGHGHKV